jgi:MFS family permease
VGPMVFSLLATEVPPERRSTVLNLVYLPLYAAGVVGPAVGAVTASVAGVAGPFLAGSLILAAGAVVVLVAMRRGRTAAVIPGTGPRTVPPIR